MAGLVKRAKRAVARGLTAGRRALNEDSPAWAQRSLGPPLKYLDMLLFDFGVFRMIYLNRHRVSNGVWRSAQPAPHHIRRIARKGVRTIVNLRGAHLNSSYRLEREECRRLGIALVDFKIRSRNAPSKEEIFAAKELFDRIEYPMLMHCKSGADRAGLMTALYRIFKEGKPIAEARGELSLRFGHIRQADTGVLGYLFDRYLADNEKRPMPFLVWVDTVYDPREIKRTFRAKGWANRLVNGILRRE